MGSGARSQDFFGQFRGLFKEFWAKRGGRAPPAPPSGSAPGFLLLRYDKNQWQCTVFSPNLYNFNLN